MGERETAADVVTRAAWVGRWHLPATRFEVPKMRLSLTVRRRYDDAPELVGREFEAVTAVEGGRFWRGRAVVTDARTEGDQRAGATHVEALGVGEWWEVRIDFNAAWRQPER